MIRLRRSYSRRKINIVVCFLFYSIGYSLLIFRENNIGFCFIGVGVAYQLRLFNSFVNNIINPIIDLINPIIDYFEQIIVVFRYKCGKDPILYGHRYRDTLHSKAQEYLFKKWERQIFAVYKGEDFVVINKEYEYLKKLFKNYSKNVSIVSKEEIEKIVKAKPKNRKELMVDLL
ncbi:hypothetical protein KY343_03640 [Candidatus Woesearchaeota archaeon]|nr:hypothetical protein [Candidatus Woesearchaeota archaeon]